MKMKLSKEEVLVIIKEHLIEKGFIVSKVETAYLDKQEYEYYGDPTRQDRREITKTFFDGIEAHISL